MEWKELLWNTTSIVSYHRSKK